ncbi:hypothetical protein [Antarctobacter heliothermus]|uniref:Uncharacterized protein n=1 Tax=Antarctobacter heliothermus TaxID=74033 RepID=A0A239GPU5_9RHOB|nr:hypothetical protein [Antarctobacter heliothermus]SNS71157.1 hypothetical protein SAMN04488078_102824 [Antarctobacter heliothermus]
MALTEIAQTGYAKSADKAPADRLPVNIDGMARRLVGAAMTIAAFLLWLVPEGITLPSVLLIKLGVSIVFLGVGLTLMTVPKKPAE